MIQLLQRARQRFNAISPREQRMLLIAVAVLSLAAIYLTGEWLYHANQRVSRDLPLAKARLARMQAEADELQRLPESKSVGSNPDTVLEATRAAARTRGLELQIEAVADGFKVSGSAPFDTLVDWLASLQSQQKLRPGRLQLNGQGSQVGVDALLVRADN